MAQEKKHIKLLRTIGVTGAAYVINYLITLFLTPYVTENIGTDAYGFVSFAKNIAQYATYVTMALNSLAGRYISIEYHRNNKDKANIYFSSTFFGDVFLGTAMFGVGVVLILFLEKAFTIPAGLVNDVKFLFIFVFLKFWIVTVFSVYSVGAYVSNKLDVTGVFKGLSYVAEAVILLILFLAFKPSVAFVGIGLLIATVVIVLSDIWITRRYVGDLRIRKADFRMSAVKTLVGGGIWTSVTQLGNFLHNGLDLAICNLMLTPLAMGQLAIAQSMDMIFKSMMSIVSHAFQPNLLKIYAEDDKDGLLKELVLAMNVSALLSNLAFAGFMALGMAYYRLWIPKEDISLIYILTIVCVSSGISSGIITPCYYIYSLTAKKIVSAFITLISGALNVLSMYFLIRYTNLGIYAVVLTTAVLVTLINFLPHPLYMAYLLKLPWHTFYPAIGRNLLSCIVMTILLKGLSMIYMPSSWLLLGICIVLYSVVGALVHAWIVLDRNQRRNLMNRVMKKGFRIR